MVLDSDNDPIRLESVVALDGRPRILTGHVLEPTRKSKIQGYLDGCTGFTLQYDTHDAVVVDLVRESSWPVCNPRCVDALGTQLLH